MSREKILAAIAKAKPAAVALPEKFSPVTTRDGLTHRYFGTLRSIGGVGILVNSLDEIEQHLEAKRATGKEVVNCIRELSHYNAAAYLQKSANEMESVHTVCLRGGVAVAENGACWVTEKAMVRRLLPFICQELALVIFEDDLVATMHHAYNRIAINEDGFGTFIAGPSKTADIEQSLVIGAHGPLSLQVFVLAKQAAVNLRK